jgi:hypothetical protein
MLKFEPDTTNCYSMNVRFVERVSDGSSTDFVHDRHHDTRKAIGYNGQNCNVNLSQGLQVKKSSPNEIYLETASNHPMNSGELRLAEVSTTPNLRSAVWRILLYLLLLFEERASLHL